MGDAQYSTLVQSGTHWEPLPRAIAEPHTDVGSRCMQGCTTLHVAAQHDCVECVSSLLKSRCDVNSQDKHGDTALHVAIRRGCCERIISVLVEHEQMDHGLTNDRGYDLLHYAVHKQHLTAAAKIASLSPHLCKKTHAKGYAPIHSAAAAGDCQMIDILMGCNETDLEVKDHDYRRTPLLLAVQNKQTSAVKNLVKWGADKAARDINGNTCLHYAVALCCLDFKGKANDASPAIDLLECLLREGADPLLENIMRKPAYEFATEFHACRTLNHYAMEMVRALREHMCTFCKVQPRSVTFLPCGHSLACYSCGVPKVTCPACLQHVEQRGNASGVSSQQSADTSLIISLGERIQLLESQILCPVCRVSQRDIVYDCGHTVCSSCSTRLYGHCPLCRRVSQKQTHFFL